MTTLVIQSSSATVGMAIGLAKAGVLPLKGGVAVMLGAEIGTCADTLVATLGGRREALRVGVFHLAFNLASVLVGLLLIDALCALALALSPEGGAARQIAHAHLAFNALGALAVTPFVGRIAEALERRLPARGAVAGAEEAG